MLWLAHKLCLADILWWFHTLPCIVLGRVGILLSSHMPGYFPLESNQEGLIWQKFPLWFL